jgi:metal-sulfur cluster biosynthetic enzyme
MHLEPTGDAPPRAPRFTPHTREAPMAVTEKAVMDALKTVKDPELNLNLVVLGLVYDVDVQGTHVDTRISLTSPMCPVAEQIVHMAEEAVLGVEGVETAKVQLTFDPPWTPERIAPLIRSSLGL